MCVSQPDASYSTTASHAIGVTNALALDARDSGLRPIRALEKTNRWSVC